MNYESCNAQKKSGCNYNIYIFPPHFFSQYHSRFMKDEPIKKLELITQYIKKQLYRFCFHRCDWTR